MNRGKFFKWSGMWVPFPSVCNHGRFFGNEILFTPCQRTPTKYLQFHFFRMLFHICSFFSAFRSTKDRIWRYFRLSSRRSDNDNKFDTQNSAENSITQVNTTETLDIETNISHTPKSSMKHHHHHQQQQHGRSAPKTNTLTSLHATANALRAKQLVDKQDQHQRANEKRTNSTKKTATPTPSGKLKHSNNRDRTERLHLSDDINNSCSNITASTYLNGIEISSTSGEFGGSTAEMNNRKNSGSSANSAIIGVDRDNSVYSGISNDRISHRSHDMLSESGGNLLALRRESSSTYERDMDIIDLLERERSFDMNEDVTNRERQRKFQTTKMMSATYMGRPKAGGGSGGGSERRKLPDITKITTLSTKLPASAVAPLSPKQRLIQTASGSGTSIDHHHQQTANFPNEFPNFVFTHQQYNEFAEARINRNRDLNGAIVNKSSTTAVMGCSRNNSQTSFSGGGGSNSSKRSSDAYAWNDDDNTIVSVNRVTRARSIDSRKNSTKSNNDDIRGDSGGGGGNNSMNTTYANNL